MKNIFKNPKSSFRFVVVLIFLVSAYYLTSYLLGVGSKKDVVKEPSVPPPTEEKVEQKLINFNEFGVVHIEVESPSYAKSNFDVNPETPITVYFNGEVDPQDVVDRFRLFNKNTGEIVKIQATSELQEQKDGKSSYTWKWEEVWKQKLIFTPVSKLEPVSMYGVLIGLGYRDISNFSTAEKAFSFEFLTADKPGVLSTNLDNRKYKIEKGESVKVNFRSPMSKEELVQRVEVYPLGTEYSLQVIDKIMTLDANLEIGSYQLFIPSGTKDIYGRGFVSDFIISFEVY